MTSHSDQKCVKDYQDVDRLSNLPDEILCHIFSFVPAKSAYKMRIFSKQWEQLLAKVPVLDFSEMPHSIMYNKRLTSQQIIYLKDFVQKVLLHNDVPYVQRLHLCCGPFGWDDDHFCVNSWLDTIRKRDIHEIEITYSYWSKVYFVLPTKFLSREGLVVLKLNGKFTFNDPMLHLPNLEILHFGGLQFPNDEFIKMLSSGCPVLKELHISQCTGITNTLYVESLSLKKLDIWYITKKTEQAGIVIKAPNLRYLYLNDTLKQPVIGDLSSLVEANLSIEYDTVDHALQVLQSVSMVKFLSLTNSDHYKFVSKSPVFHNLTCLELDNTDKLCTILGCTPKLKCLIFTQVQMSTPSNRRRLENCQGVDHISNLPDVILCHILSFIPTKLSIMTSILSKRWKYLWTKVAALDFTTDALLNPCKSLTLKKKISFQSFVDRVLLHNDASYLRHLCFDVLSGVDEFYVKSWLSAIARREIRMIRITRCQPMVDCIPLPSGFLSSEKLVVLKLSGTLSIDFPTSFHLPNLETTHLTGLQLPGDEFLKRLSLGCPVLRELCILNCHGRISTLHIESSSLETLNIEATFSISGSTSLHY